jgi:hypothetical protein
MGECGAAGSLPTWVGRRGWTVWVSRYGIGGSATITGAWTTAPPKQCLLTVGGAAPPWGGRCASVGPLPLGTLCAYTHGSGVPRGGIAGKGGGG